MTEAPVILMDDPAPWVRRITLNRPQARNALNTQVLEEIAAALDAAAASNAVRCVVLTGSDKAFAAGADLKELAAHDAVSIQSDRRPRFWRAIRDFPKPMIAAVNGYCLGGGNELAMHADIIVAGDNAVFGQPEINLGLIPGAGGTQRLVAAVGKARAMKMVLGGETITAAEALAAGLVTETIAPELCLERALTLASLIATKPPLAAQLAKEAVLKSYELPLAEALNYERKAFCLLFATADRTEGIAAFTERRKPNFRGC